MAELVVRQWFHGLKGEGSVIQNRQADATRARSPRRCSNSGVALITLIGRLGVEHIAEFDLTPAHTHTQKHF